MEDLVINSNRAYVYINLDYVIMNIFKTFRVYFYTKLIIKNIHPLDINYENISNGTFNELYNNLLLETNDKFWNNINISNVCNFYLKRLKEYDNRIFLYTTGNETLLSYKTEWINNNLKIYKNKLLYNIEFKELASNILYKNILISNDKNDCDLWTSYGGISFWDLGKRSVASYYVEKIKYFLNYYNGVDLYAPPSGMATKRRPNIDKKYITSIEVDDLYLI